MRTRAIAVGLLLVAASIGLALTAHADGKVVFGTGWWQQTFPEAKFQEYRDVPQGAFLDSLWWRENWAHRWAFSLVGSDAIRRDQAYRGLLAHGVRTRLDLSYQQIPHLLSRIIRNAYTEASPGVRVLPDFLQASNVANADSAVAHLQDFIANRPHENLGFRTDIGRARLRERPAEGLQLEGKVERRLRAGRKAYGAGFGMTTAIEQTEPVDQRMVEGDASANYLRNRFKAQLGVGFSSFDNRVNSLFFDAPRRIADSLNAPGHGQIALEPDNSVLRGRAALGFDLPMKSVVTATVSAARGHQNQDWLPYTVNTALAQSSLDSLPARSTDAVAWQLAGDLRLSTRALGPVDATVRVHHHRYKNETPVYLFSGQSVNDRSFSVEPIENEPFGSQQTSTALELGWSPARQLRLAGTYELINRVHTLREIAHDQENAFELRAASRPFGPVDLNVHWRHGVRVAGAFNQEGSGGDNPLVGRFDVASRRQDLVTAGLGLPVGERVDLGVEYDFLQNRFPDTVYGLQLWMQHSGLVRAGVHLSDRVDLGGGYGIAWPRTRQQAHQSGGTSFDWTGRILEKSQWAYAEGSWWARPEKLQLSADYSFGRDLGDYFFTAPGALDLPHTYSLRHAGQLQAMYRVMANTELGLRYGYDEYKVHDWAFQNLPLVTTNLILLDDELHSYHANRVAVVATRRF